MYSHSDDICRGAVSRVRLAAANPGGADVSHARRWSAIADDEESSGLTWRAFAKALGIHPSTLAAWRSTLGRSSTHRAVHGVCNGDFTERVVREEDAAAEGDAADNERSVLASGALVVRLGSRDTEVVVEHDTALALLRRVVEALC